MPLKRGTVSILKILVKSCEMKGDLLKIKARKPPKKPLCIEGIFNSRPSFLTDFQVEITQSLLE